MTADRTGFWPWFLGLPDWVKVFAMLGSISATTFALGLTVAAAFTQQKDLPRRMDRAENEATENRIRIEILEASANEFRRFAGCVLTESVSDRDIGPCKYILRDPNEIRPPTR